MHKSYVDIFSKDNSVRPIADEVLNGLGIKDRDKSLSESNKKLITRVLNLVDSGMGVPESVRQAKEEGYPQVATAIAVVDGQEKGNLAQVVQDTAQAIDPDTMNLAKSTFQQRAQEEIIGSVVETLTVYPPAIGDNVQKQMLGALREPGFVSETNHKIKEACAKALGR
jgi:hypothetical protein